MSVKPRATRRLVTVLLGALAATAGCDQKPDEPANPRSPEASIATKPESDRAESVALPKSNAEADELHRDELEAQIAALESERNQLQLDRTRIAALVQSHQSEGETRLATFKEELRALQSRATRDPQASHELDRFAERARNDLEQSLLLDQEYQSQLSTVTKELSATESRLQELHAAVQALPAHE
jgi:chromosome segregation ATPase